MDLTWHEEANLACQMPSANPSSDVCKAFVDGVCSRASPTQGASQLQLLQPHQLTSVGQQPFIQLLQRVLPGQTCSGNTFTSNVSIAYMACSGSTASIRQTVLWHVCHCVLQAKLVASQLHCGHAHDVSTVILHCCFDKLSGPTVQFDWKR